MEQDPINFFKDGLRFAPLWDMGFAIIAVIIVIAFLFLMITGVEMWEKSEDHPNSEMKNQKWMRFGRKNKRDQHKNKDKDKAA